MQEAETTPTGDKQKGQGDACAADMHMDMTDPSDKDAPKTDMENDEKKKVAIKRQIHGGIGRGRRGTRP